VIEVIAQHDHGDDIEERNRPDLEAGDDIVVDVMRFEAATGMDRAESEVQKVKDDEGQDDGAAPRHGARSIGRMEVDFFHVTDGAGFALEEPELEGGPHVEKHGDEQSDARNPQKGGMGTQCGRIIIDFFRWQKDLQVSEQMANHKAEEKHTGDGHDHLFPDGRLPKPEAAGRKSCRRDAHRMYGSLSEAGRMPDKG